MENLMLNLPTIIGFIRELILDWTA